MSAPTTPKQPDLVSVTSINRDGSRYFIHPADVSGPWARARSLVAWGLMLLFFALPWIPVGGFPAVFLDTQTRNFHVFGFHFAIQDFWLLFFCLTGLGFSLFFLTALFGRLWCGWTCPYILPLDHLYRRVERWIEGDSVARRRLDQAPWTAGKIAKWVTKHAIYLALSAIIAHAFLAYFVSIPRLYSFIQAGPMKHHFAFGVAMFLTFVLWFCWGYFREQFCIIMCPYGRLQSALTDDDTVTVGYDRLRGEPRGPAGKVEGDCIDCRRCVNVCPTGIDIRNGLQLECVACTACIDACDAVMTKIGKPKGLIRYDSLNGFSGKKRRVLRPRIYVYGALGALGLAAFSTVVALKASPFTVTIGRVSGPGYSVDAEVVRNSFIVRVKNKRQQPATITVSLATGAPDGYRVAEETASFTVPPLEEVARTCSLIAPLGSYQGQGQLIIQFASSDGGKVVKKVPFAGPNPAAVKRPTP
ncbi:MAG: cytochrome c oxidase accessory protein CcoG [Akkermansiaceae bacterium]|nr:cytochrome c oxidase accessory protein CcoG [Akkermansiaceae bacterium]